MSKYINADEFLDFFDIGSEEAREENRGEIITAEDIDRFPAADVIEVKHAKWELNNVHDNYEYYQCSHCNYEIVCDRYFGENTNEYNYCPYCAAKMDKKEHNND